MYICGIHSTELSFITSKPFRRCGCLPAHLGHMPRQGHKIVMLQTGSTTFLALALEQVRVYYILLT